MTNTPTLLTPDQRAQIRARLMANAVGFQRHPNFCAIGDDLAALLAHADAADAEIARLRKEVERNVLARD